MVKNLILGTLRKFGYEIFKTPASTAGEHETIAPRGSYAPWKIDSAFATAYDACKTQTLVDIYRCYEIWSLVGECS